MKLKAPLEQFSFTNSVSQLFGANALFYKKNFGLPAHNGLDCRGTGDKAGYGTKILASHDYDYSDLVSDTPIHTRGNGIYIKKQVFEDFTFHGQKVVFMETCYWHISGFVIDTSQSGKAGDVIALMGNSGFVEPRPSEACPWCGTHLHFGVRFYSANGLIDTEYNGYANPIPYLYNSGDKFAIRLFRNLTVGSEGEDVAFLQTIFQIEGFAQDYEPTGVFGPKTMRDVIKLQQKYGLSPAIGFVGPKTREVLNQRYSQFP